MKIPRAEATVIATKVEKEAKKLFGEGYIEVVTCGSYRRGRA